jgi:serine/threonine protein kinase
MLVDFGIAKIAQGGERTVTGARGGTPGFSPPEQYSGSGTTPVSDIYSLGATLYAVLTGQKPPDSISLLVNQAKFKPPTELNPKLSREVSEAILWAMQPRLEERPQSVTAWREALEGILKAPGRSSQAEATITDCATVMESTGRDVSPPIPPVLPDSGQQTKRTVVKWGIGIGLIAIVILVVLAAAITFLAINRGGKTVNIDTLLAVFSIPTQQPDGKPQTETDPEVGVVVTAEASGQIETPLVSNNSTTPESADTLIAPTSTRQSKPTNIPIPATKTPKPKPTATPTIDTGSYSHDFSFDDGNWDTGQRNYDSGSIDMNLVDGKYRVSITPKLDDYAYRFCPDKVNGWKDFVVSVDMWPISGPFPMYYGIYFRGTDWDNYYRLIITNDSKYSVLVEKGGQFQELVTWSYSPAIQNAEKNHVKIEANGSTIKFYVNSQYLTTVDDDKLKRGDVCFWIGQWGDYYAGSITTIDFDNLSITALP